MYLGTPQTTFTIYRKLAERSYRPLVWPARYPRGKNVTQYEGLLAPDLQADIDNGAEEWAPTDDRFTNDDLLEREASMGRSNYMLQFQLDTSLSDAEKFPLKMADLIVTSVNPKILHPKMLYGAQIPPMSLKTHPQLDYRETISIHLCNCKEIGKNMTKPFVVLTHPVGEQTKQRLVIYPNATESSICMKCEHTETGTVIIPCSTSLEDVKSTMLQAWLSKQTLETVS